MILLNILLFFLLILIIVLIILSTNRNIISIIGGKKQYITQTPFNLKTKSFCFTYKLFSNDDKFCKYLKNKLDALGWKEADDNAKYVDFAYKSYHTALINKNISKKFLHINADLKYTLNNVNILGNKRKLAAIMNKSLHIVPTKSIYNYKWNNNIVIVREVHSQRRRGVYIVPNNKIFIKLKNMLLSKKKNAIVSKYIINPLLYKDKKFHLRIYITIFIDKNGNKKIKYMTNYMMIIMAKAKYMIKSSIDYLDHKMTISGGYSEPILWNINQCCYLSHTSINFFNKCNKSIDSAINSIPLDSISLYPEQNAGFYTYGGDIMLDNNGNAYILELNRNPGIVSKWRDAEHGTFNDAFMNYLFKVYDFLLDEFILPYFGYKKNYI